MTPEPQQRNTEDALAGTSARVERLLDELAEAHPEAHARAEEAIRLLLELYGAAFGRILAAAKEEGGGDRTGPVLEGMLGDPLVSGLLILHDLHPLDTAARVQRALDGIRPYLDSHAGGVELLDADGATVRLRLRGNCEGCPSSAETVRGSIERAIAEAAPEVAAVEVEGIAGPEPADPGFVPLGSVRRRPPEHAMTCTVPSGAAHRAPPAGHAAEGTG